MKTSFWTPYISDDTIKAICWTLIHSLWIGMIIALITGLVITLTRKSTAVVRYRLLCITLILFVLSVGVTYFLQIRSASHELSAVSNLKIVRNPGNNVIVYYTDTRAHASFINNAVSFLDQNMNIIFLVWTLFFVLKSLKMVSGLLYIQRIRNYKVHEVAEEFKHKIELFSRQIGIRQTVGLVQSELVKVPVAVGWLKPVILLPVGVILQLSTEQLESILWHELAHICRRDYLVNILQGLVETVFFFNPGLLWLSSLIRAEREACCDDIVLSRTNHKANYLEALLSFGYENNSRTTLAMSIGGGNQLRDRLKRMINQENKRLSVPEKAVLGIGFILLSAFTTMPKAGQAATNFAGTVSKTISAIIKKHGDTTSDAAKALATEKQLSGEPEKTGGKIIIKTADTAIHFTSVLFKHSDAGLANNDISAMDDKGNKYHFIVVDNVITALEINDEKIADDKLAGFQYMMRYIDREVAMKRRFRAEDIARLKANSPAAKFKDQDSLSFDKQKYVDGQKTGDMNMKLEALKKRFYADSISYPAQLQKMMNVIADLVAEKVVLKASDVKWFGLSNTELIVNGQKQSGAMQQRFKAKYSIREDYGLYYGPVQMYGRGVFIDLSEKPLRPERPVRPMKPERPGPKSMGIVKPFRPADSTEWKIQQLMRQQQLFEAEQNDKRKQLIKLQELFVADQNKKRDALQQQQQLFVADQDEKRRQIIKQQQFLLSEQAKRYQQWKSGNDQSAESKIELSDIVASITDDLVSANVLRDKDELVKFNLTNSALMVNGKKQPEEIHERLKAKFLQQPNYQIKQGITADPNFGVHFNTQNGAMGLGITIGPDSP
jgi:bla regulator protein BlaR1